MCTKKSLCTAPGGHENVEETGERMELGPIPFPHRLSYHLIRRFLLEEGLTWPWLAVEHVSELKKKNMGSKSKSLPMTNESNELCSVLNNIADIAPKITPKHVK